jgi:hypothetical protein
MIKGTDKAEGAAIDREELAVTLMKKGIRIRTEAANREDLVNNREDSLTEEETDKGVTDLEDRAKDDKELSKQKMKKIAERKDHLMWTELPLANLCQNVLLIIPSRGTQTLKLKWKSLKKAKKIMMMMKDNSKNKNEEVIINPPDAKVEVTEVAKIKIMMKVTKTKTLDKNAVEARDDSSNPDIIRKAEMRETTKRLKRVIRTRELRDLSM